MWDLIKALQAGHELADPAAWKKGQNLMNLTASVITGLVAVLHWKWPELPVTDEQIIDIASVAAGILAVINGYLTTATSKKVGV
ncbi:MAG: hypothetical protein ACOYB1_18450 [Limnohabitans sp.]